MKGIEFKLQETLPGETFFFAVFSCKLAELLPQINRLTEALIRGLALCFASPGSSVHSYTQGSFTHQLNKELDNVKNQRNKLGEFSWCASVHVSLRARRLLTGRSFLSICPNVLIWTWTRTP